MTKQEGAGDPAGSLNDAESIWIEEIFDPKDIDVAAQTAFDRALNRHPADHYTDTNQRREVVRNYAHAVVDGIRRSADTANKMNASGTRTEDANVYSLRSRRDAARGPESGALQLSASGDAVVAFDRPWSEIAPAAEEQIPWIVEGAIVEGEPGVVGGEPKQGKSLLAACLLASVAGGASTFLGIPIPERRRCLLIEEEDGIGRTARRLIRLARGHGLTLEDAWFRLAVRTGFRLNDPAWVDRATSAIDQFRPALIVIDVLQVVAPAADTDPALMEPLLDQLTWWSREFKTAPYLVHHFKKTPPGTVARGGTLLRGTSVLHGWVNSGFYLHSADKSGIRRLEIESKDAEGRETYFVIVDKAADALALEVVEPASGTNKPKRKSAVAYVIDETQTDPERWLPVPAVMTAIGLKSKSTVLKELQGGVDTGKLERRESSGGAYWFRRKTSAS